MSAAAEHDVRQIPAACRPKYSAEVAVVKPTEALLNRYFTGLTEFVFHSHLGVADTTLVDYVSGILVRFTRTESIHKVRSLTGRPLTEVAEMLAEANQRVGVARRQVHRHIGDFTLFWAGVYPEALRQMQSAGRKDHFVDYCSQGKRAYRIASSIETDDEAAPEAGVLDRLSREFELCAYGLREVRNEWERRDDEFSRMLLID